MRTLQTTLLVTTRRRASVAMLAASLASVACVEAPTPTHAGSDAATATRGGIDAATTSHTGGDAAASACTNVDVCGLLTLDDVNAAMGGGFDDIEPGFKGDTGPDVFSDSCWYWRRPEEVIAQRSCYVDAGAASTSFDEIFVGPPISFGAHTAVTGIGDKATYVVVASDAGVPAMRWLYVLAGHELVELSDSDNRVSDDSRPALVTFARKLLSH